MEKVEQKDKDHARAESHKRLEARMKRIAAQCKRQADREARRG